MSNFYSDDDDFAEGRGRSYGLAALLFVLVGIIALVWWINNSGAGGAPQPATAASVDSRTFRSPAVTDKQFEEQAREARLKAGQPPLLTPEQQKVFEDARNKTAPNPQPITTPAQNSQR